MDHESEEEGRTEEGPNTIAEENRRSNLYPETRVSRERDNLRVLSRSRPTSASISSPTSVSVLMRLGTKVMMRNCSSRRVFVVAVASVEHASEHERSSCPAAVDRRIPPLHVCGDRHDAYDSLGLFVSQWFYANSFVCVQRLDSGCTNATPAASLKRMVSNLFAVFFSLLLPARSLLLVFLSSPIGGDRFGHLCRLCRSVPSKPSRRLQVTAPAQDAKTACP